MTDDRCPIPDADPRSRFGPDPSADPLGSSIACRDWRGMTPRCPSSVAKSSAGVPARNPRQARWPTAMRAAGSVVASMARCCPDQSTKGREVFVPTASHVPAGRRACTWGDDEPGRRGHRGACEKCRVRPACVARKNLHRTPSESGRPGRIQAPVWRRAKCLAAATQARAAGRREAHHALPEHLAINVLAASAAPSSTAARAPPRRRRERPAPRPRPRQGSTSTAGRRPPRPQPAPRPPPGRTG